MEWTDIQITVPQQYAETAEAIATMVSNGGIYIEDYRDLEQQAWEIAHVDLIEQDLLDQPRDIVKVHMYLAPDENPAEILPLFKERLEASGVEYKLETSGIEQEDWQNAWKKYYHAMDIGQRLAIVPGWETYDTDRIVITMDPGMAFGTGTHETTSLCLETLDSMVKGGERVLDIGTGSGILAIAALKLGAAEAEGVDIDPMCVRTAGENAKRNGVAEHFTVLVGDLSDKASGKYNIITANIVAAAILSLAPHVPVLMAPGARFIASGIIDTRKDEVLAGLRAAGLEPVEIKEKRGWVCVICKNAAEV
jgi:ribosomal protein L11 methyltransferase